MSKLFSVLFVVKMSAVSVNKRCVVHYCNEYNNSFHIKLIANSDGRTVVVEETMRCTRKEARMDRSLVCRKFGCVVMDGGGLQATHTASELEDTPTGTSAAGTLLLICVAARRCGGSTGLAGRGIPSASCRAASSARPTP
jgi:hypothetical protein